MKTITCTKKLKLRVLRHPVKIHAVSENDFIISTSGRVLRHILAETDLFCDITHRAWHEWHYVDSL